MAWSNQPPQVLPRFVFSPLCQCLCMRAEGWISLCLSDKPSEVVGANEKLVRFRLRAHDWRTTLPSLGVYWCWQESTVPCSLTESWHRFHFERRTIHMPLHCCISNNLLKPKQTGKRISVSLIEMPLSKPPPIVTTSTLKHHGTCIIGTCALKYLPVIC